MKVTKRAVCYISGFDPRGVRHYHNLYKTEIKKHGEMVEETFSTSKRKSSSHNSYTWQTSCAERSNFQLDYFFLSHEDVIKKNWIKTQSGLFWETWRCYYAMARTRMFGKILKRYKPAIYSTSYPFVFGALTILISFIIFILLGLLIPLSPTYTWSIAALVGLSSLWIGKWIDSKFNHYWLMRTIAFILLCKYRQQPDLDKLKDRMAHKISELDQTGEYDEILVIGHSYGAVLGVEIAAHLLKCDPQIGKRKAEVSYISLAGIVSLAHANDADPDYKKAVYTLGTQNQIDWIDLGARADGACTSMLDPFYAAEVDIEGPHYPRLFPVRFFKCFSPEAYKNIQKNKFEFHFQYLKTTEFLGEYNFFEMLLGENTIDSLYPRGDQHPVSIRPS